MGNAGNPADPLNSGSVPGIGSVNYEYNIGKYEVTNAQYASFLNATAATDTYGLYNTNMGSSVGGISRSGSAGSYTYSTIGGRENKPVNYVSFWDAARFTNWLTTGDTETGVYMLTADGIANNTITRDATAWANGGFAIASENEWYKAAYYAGSPTGADGDGYWLYPTQSNSISNPDANYFGSVGTLTDVGSYSDVTSYYGTFDQGGNVAEWNDEIVTTDTRGLRGGGYNNGATLKSSYRLKYNPSLVETSNIGFRVSSLEPIVIPEPSTYAAIFGGLGLLIVLLRRHGRSAL